MSAEETPPREAVPAPRSNRVAGAKAGWERRKAKEGTHGQA